ncbi:hypothetical protein EYF80_053601 [Liparis tanakae]|uniref:Uncharacterized protein n=1 Tax=Liparis tanakae TaxID=230148 RepID=A0A4Z2F651_9TELE|nr:hypothetical protein EYF80_053601 [Liparis tanakae]
MLSSSRRSAAAASSRPSGLALPSGVLRSPGRLPGSLSARQRLHRYRAPTPSASGVPTNRASCQRGSPAADGGSTGLDAAIDPQGAVVSQQEDSRVLVGVSGFTSLGSCNDRCAAECSGPTEGPEWLCRGGLRPPRASGLTLHNYRQLWCAQRVESRPARGSTYRPRPLSLLVPTTLHVYFYQQ